ncbi:MAG TPA: UDP-N-acetylglucosamine 2-epimerase (non-hydrolyzing) [Clostridiaceae bacterium]|nr:UDP-N-acetylglucosamine 2-epimerase (non-hydrolyzing) [Clostridiaceae bacterium]
MNKLKVAIIFGTRPDAIKMVPLVKELRLNSNNIETVVCVTAQHRQMLDQVLNIFDVVPDYDLNIMQSRQTLEHITTRSLEGLSAVFEEIKPDVVLVHGDTTTCFAASLAAFYKKIKVGHVEAGLRTFDKYYPYPEEMNRRLTGVIADFHFCPTPSNKENLLREGVCEKSIYITGNTVIDALKTTVRKDYIFKDEVLKNFDFNNKIVLTVEAHRRENLGTPLENICQAVRTIADSFDDVEIIYPVHLNPAVRETVVKVLGNHNKIHLIDPIDVQDMHNLIDRSYMILTDSGGLQEEAPSLGKPVLVLRNETERPEAVKAGTVALAGTDKENIIKLTSKLLNNAEEYSKMSKAVNPYGDGKASQRIVQALLYEFGFTDVKPEDFQSVSLI